MESQHRLVVDADHCRRAVEELTAVLSRQERAFLARFDFRNAARRVVLTARVVGLVACGIGLALCAFAMYADRDPWLAQPRIVLLPFFVSCSLVFAFEPRLSQASWNRLFRRADRRARRTAERAVSMARKIAPFEADYNYKSDVLTYARGKNDVWQPGWTRALKRYRARGLAVQTESATVIFRRPNSSSPAVVILHDSREWTASVLQDAGIATEVR